MALAAGDRLGPYEVLSTLGAGGMGEVYRARDATLKRDVALKILPDGFALDPERLARFKREAQVLASLNHSNIAAIYGFEDAKPSTGSGQAVQALVLELVEGQRLPIASHLDRFPSRKRSRLRGRSPKRSKPPTSRGSSTAISSPRM